MTSSTPPSPAGPEQVFEALRVVGGAREDGFTGAGPRRIVHRVSVYAEPARRLQKALGGDCFSALLTLLMNCEEDDDSASLRMPGGQLRLRKLLGWGEERTKRVFRQLEAAGFVTSEQEKAQRAGTGMRYGQTFLIPNPALWRESATEPVRDSSVPGNPEASPATPIPGPGKPGTGKPRSEDVSAGQPAPPVPGTEVRGTSHDDDDVSFSTSSWDGATPRATASAPRVPDQGRAQGSPQTLGATLSSAFPGLAPAAARDAERPLRDEVSFAEVVEVLVGWGFTDGRKFATEHWGASLVGWVNHIRSTPAAHIANPGAYLRSMLRAGRVPPEPGAAAAASAQPPAPIAAAPTPPAESRWEPAEPEAEAEDDGTVLDQAQVEQVLASLPEPLAAEVADEVQVRLGAAARWILVSHPSAAARRQLWLARLDVLSERGLLPGGGHDGSTPGDSGEPAGDDDAPST